MIGILGISGSDSSLLGDNSTSPKLTRSKTAPYMKQSSLESLKYKPPFISASASRECFDFGIHGLKTPRWSMNTLFGGRSRNDRKQRHGREDGDDRREELQNGNKEFRD